MSSCTLTIDTGREQCTVTADCRARGGEFAKSTCVDSFCVEPTPDVVPTTEEIDGGGGAEGNCARNSDCSGTSICIDKACTDPFACEKPVEVEATVTVPVRDVFGTPLVGTPSKLCRSIDPECLTPVETLETDAEGKLTFGLTAGFTGYLEFVVDGYFPQLQFLPEVFTDGQELAGASLSPVEFIYGLAQKVGATPDPERGHLSLNLLNCYGAAEHLEVSSSRADDGTYIFYVLNGVPSADLTETTVEGSAGFLNFPSGNAAVTVTHAETQEELAKFAYVIRAGYLTVARAQPYLE